MDCSIPSKLFNRLSVQLGAPHAEDAFHEALKHNEVTGKLQRLRLLTAIWYARNGLRREFDTMKTTNKNLEDKIRHMQHTCKSALRNAAWSLCYRCAHRIQGLWINRASTKQTNMQFCHLAPAPSDSDTESF